MHRLAPFALLVAFAGSAQGAVQIATVDTPGSVHDLVFDGTIGYVADGLSGIRVIDFANAAAPVEIASLPPIALGNVAALALDGDRLYAAEAVGGISIVDVANPASPVRLGSISGFDTTSDVVASGDYAFVISTVGPLGFYVVDVSDPANPVQVAALDANGAALRWIGPTLLIAGSRLIDVSDPPNPVVVEESLPLFTGAAGDGFAITGDVARYDLSDPVHPVLVNQWPLPTTESIYVAAAVDAELAWLVSGSAGLAVFDVSDAEPSHPLVASVDYPAFTTVRRVRLVGTRLYVAAVGSSGRGLYVYDASNPAALTPLGFLAGDVGDLDVAGTVAFYSDSNANNEPAGLYAVDVANPAAMTVIGFVPYTTPDLVSVAGNRLYVVDTHLVQDVLLVFDVSNPAAPVQIGSKGALGNVQGLASSGNLVALTTLGALNGRLRILDATTPSAIAQLGEYTTTGQPTGLAVVGNLAYVTSGVAEVVDFSLPFAPNRIASFDQPSTSFGHPAPAGSRLYVTATGGSVLTLDLSDLAVPRVVGASVITSPRNSFVPTGDAVATSTALFFGSVAGTSARLRVFDTSQPSGLGPRRLASFPAISGSLLQLDPTRDLAFVLDGVIRVVDIAADRLLDECANGLDDDGDALVDHALDPGCRDGHDATERADCSDSVDDDGDGLTDFPADPGCASAAEASEAPNCDDGVDDDGDGFIDFGGDPGCSGRLSELENAKCQNGIDDDGDGKIDFDGGASLNGGVPIAPADPNCPTGSRNKEVPSGCGLGFEIALAVLALRRARRRLPAA